MNALNVENYVSVMGILMIACSILMMMSLTALIGKFAKTETMMTITAMET